MPWRLPIVAARAWQLKSLSFVGNADYVLNANRAGPVEHRGSPGRSRLPMAPGDLTLQDAIAGPPGGIGGPRVN